MLVKSRMKRDNFPIIFKKQTIVTCITDDVESLVD